MGLPSESQPALLLTFFPSPKPAPQPRCSPCSLLPRGHGAQGRRGADLDQVGGEALGPQPLLDAVGAAQGALQAAGPGLQQGGADALVGPVVPVLGGQPGDVDQAPALGVVGVVARVAEQVAGGQL